MWTAPHRIPQQQHRRRPRRQSNAYVLCEAAKVADGGPLPVQEPSEQQQHVLAPAAVLPPTFIKAADRIVAFGDIHGDLQKAVTALETAGVLTEHNQSVKWTGGNTVVVQLGDVLDRGDSEIGVIMMLRELDRQAKLEGGRVIMLNGNHESLNVCGDFRYTTPGGLRESALAAGLRDLPLEDVSNQLKARYMLYSPGGGMARELAKNPTVLLVNDILFAHGGVLPPHVSHGLERLNHEVSAWMRGELTQGRRARPPYHAMGYANSVVWTRQFGQERFKSAYDRMMTCAKLHMTLDSVGARHLVIGHTPQLEGANCECDRRVWRMDVGMSEGVLNANPQAKRAACSEHACVLPVILLFVVLEITQEQGQSVVRIIDAALVYH
eukprot:jgi/Astpho2/5539/Aster-02800